MTKEQAEELAADIQSKLPFHHLIVMQSTDMRNAPSNYFIAIRRAMHDERMLLIHSRFEWDQALLAWEIIRD